MFDNTAAYIEGIKESQQGEGGLNHNNNCLPTAAANSYMAMGYPDVDPQHITDVELGPNWQGGEYFTSIIDYTCKYVDSSLQISIESPLSGSLIEIIEKYGKLGYPMIFSGHCTRAADYVDYNTGINHCSSIIRHLDYQGGWLVLINSEWGQEVGYDDAEVEKIYNGAILVFHKPVTTHIVNPSPKPVVEDTMIRIQVQHPTNKYRVDWLQSEGPGQPLMTGHIDQDGIHPVKQWGDGKGVPLGLGWSDDNTICALGVEEGAQYSSEWKVGQDSPVTQPNGVIWMKIS